MGFYFTRQDCNLDWTEWQYLYSHQGMGTRPIGRDLRSSRLASFADSITLYLGCSGDGAKSSVVGDVIRVVAADHAGHKVGLTWTTLPKRWP